MAMIVIVKADKQLIIPAGAYEKLYAPNGWELYNQEVEEEEEQESEDWDEEDSKPSLEDLKKMNMETLKDLAIQYTVDIEECKNIGDLRSKLAEELEL